MNEMMNKTGATSSRRDFLKTGAITSAAAIAGTLSAASAVHAAPMRGPHLAANPSVLKTVAAKDVDISGLPRVRQTLVAPPMVPEHEQVASTGPRIVEVELVIEEKVTQIDDDGTEIWAFTYNGTVPGPLMVVHEGDYVELTMTSAPDNVLEHNIDFHAATGALGGGALTLVQPGEKVVLRWKATKPGVFVYHCAPGGLMIPYHVVSGMNGAIMVLPRDGLKDGQGNPIRYDRAYYIGEQDFYIPRDDEGNFRKYETAGENFADSIEAMKTLTPSHVVFNGKAGALTGDNAMTGKVGETVLIVHAQANRDSRPHLIGGHGDYVWETGTFTDAPATGLETWFIRGGSAGAAAYTFQQPGLYAYVTHNLIEAVILGAVAHFKIEGEWNNDLMVQVLKPSAISTSG